MWQLTMAKCVLIDFLQWIRNMYFEKSYDLHKYPSKISTQIDELLKNCKLVVFFTIKHHIWCIEMKHREKFYCKIQYWTSSNAPDFLYRAVWLTFRVSSVMACSSLYILRQLLLKTFQAEWKRNINVWNYRIPCYGEVALWSYVISRNKLWFFNWELKWMCKYFELSTIHKV